MSMLLKSIIECKICMSRSACIVDRYTNDEKKIRRGRSSAENRSRPAQTNVAIIKKAIADMNHLVRINRRITTRRVAHDFMWLRSARHGYSNSVWGFLNIPLTARTPQPVTNSFWSNQKSYEGKAICR
ncbi:hypothetical protein TNCV_3167171 [Trichonephila clavipes]|uniref:Uncharacterized protein n=1 Tax=Trichonephila clavipes TaxID=2585209 RepID=A0A8X6USJ0_TRICX|nr:hypothetical protein TNCV_3167171 [Trichonephila clavipes]